MIRLFRQAISTAFLALAVAAAAVTVQPVALAAGTDDYPADLKTAPQDSIVDQWGFYNRECTSFAAWRMSRDGHAMSNNMKGPNGNTGHFGDATNWYDNALYIGIPTTTTRTVGYVLQSKSVGHVAYSEKTDGTVEDYNWSLTGQYLEHSWNPSDAEYLNFGPPPAGGSAANLLRNASFESGTGSWNLLPAGSGHMQWGTNPGGVDGSYYLESNANTAGGSVYQDVPLNTDTSRDYTLSLWMRVPSGSATVNLSLFGMGGTQEGAGTNNITLTTTWTRYQVTLHPIYSHTNLRVQVYENTINQNIDFDGGLLYG